MARNKRRGRPPGSKNKSKLTGSVGKMDVAQLSAHIASLRKTLASKIEQQRAFFERQLAGLTGYASMNGRRSAGSSRGSRVGRPRAGARKKPEPKYQSKKNKSLKWTGRGMTPVWMREEMKGTKLKKDDFLIK
jgi:DNA-binding protein H-NS